mgnify:CR=1 FL=1
MSGGWVYATHPETGGETRFPVDPAVIEAQEARGWVCGGPLPEHLDPDARDLAPAPAEEPAVDEPDPEPATESPTPSEQSTTPSKTKSTPAASAGDDTNGAASA